MTTQIQEDTRGRILLADDEETFRLSTADLLQREGFHCDAVPDGGEALARVTAQHYDLLVSDLKMKGNEDLELLKGVTARGNGLPIIVVTAYPSVPSTITCIDLAVAAYLVKPVEFSELLARADAAIARFRSEPGYCAAGFGDGPGQALDPVRPAGRTPASAGPAQAFLDMTLQNIAGSLRDIDQLGRALARCEAAQEHPCQLMNCPRGLQLREAVRQTIKVLEETKSSFRSKALGTLRRQLEVMLDVN
jgi:DNA-binding response OmpR family regulator